jgi:hypothetical protein
LACVEEILNGYPPDVQYMITCMVLARVLSKYKITDKHLLAQCPVAVRAGDRWGAARPIGLKFESHTHRYIMIERLDQQAETEGYYGSQDGEKTFSAPANSKLLRGQRESLS